MAPSPQIRGRQQGLPSKRPPPVARDLATADSDFARNQTRPEGRGLRSTNENLAVRALREEKEKNLAKAAKAKSTITARRQDSGQAALPQATTQPAGNFNHGPLLSTHTSFGSRETDTLSSSAANRAVWSLDGVSNQQAIPASSYSAFDLPPMSPLTQREFGSTQDYGSQSVGLQPTNVSIPFGTLGRNTYHGYASTGVPLIMSNAELPAVGSLSNNSSLPLTQNDEETDITFTDEPWTSMTGDRQEGGPDKDEPYQDTSNSSGYGLQVTSRPVTFSNKRKRTESLVPSASSHNIRGRTVSEGPSDAGSSAFGDISNSNGATLHSASIALDVSTPPVSPANPPSPAPGYTNNGRPSRSLRHIEADRKRVLEVTIELFRQHLSKVDPYPDQPSTSEDSAVGDLDEVTVLCMMLWNQAAKKLDLKDIGESPTEFELKRICERCSQFRGKLRDLAADVVPPNFGFIDVSTLKTRTQAAIADAIHHNRLLVKKLLDTFWYRDPNNLDLPDSMYRNDAIQQVLNKNWFGTGILNRRVYFKGESMVPLKTIALILTALLNTIEEWQTGRFKRVSFDSGRYAREYHSQLTRLRRWKEYCSSQAHNLTSRVQEDLLLNARILAGDEDDNLSEDAESEEAQLALFA